MIPVEKITEQELERRFNSLPQSLQEALDSAQNLQVINHICESNMLLDKEKQLMVQQTAALVLLGYVHPEKIGLELEEELGVNHRVAASIAEALNNRIFSGLRNDIDKVYSPLAQEEVERVGAEEIKKPAPMPVPAPAGGPPQPPGPPPKSFIDLGSLTKLTAPAAPSVPPPMPSPPPKELKPSITKPAAEVAPAPAQATPVPITKIPPAPPSSAPPAPPPVLLKRKLELEPIKSPAGVRIESSAPFAGTGKTSVTAPPPKPARIEVGKPQPPPPPPPKISPPSPPLPAKIVHYSQWRTPIQPASPTTTPTPSPPPPAPPAASKQGTPNISTAPLRPTPPTPPPGDKSSLPPIPPK